MKDTGRMKIVPLEGSYAIHRLDPGQEIPRIREGFHSITSTDEEISVVCLDTIELDSRQKDSPWKCLKVDGPLDLSQTGILHGLTGPLKESGIPVFAISTYLTDYLLVQAGEFDKALGILGANP